MALDFKEDAICLSGLTGSKLKCQVIGDYYPFWWSITSGGPNSNFKYSTAIVELDAATGEVYIEDTKETILGSSGHALDLKCNNPNTNNLKVILVEKDEACYKHLKTVAKRRFNIPDNKLSENGNNISASNIYLINMDLEKALNSIEKIDLGNALFFFDPLRSIEYKTIEKVASKRIKQYYRTGTEFIIFIFTSDWFLGRDEFVGLPIVDNESIWTLAETLAVLEADKLFGNQVWRKRILNNNPIDERENDLIEMYKERLHKWFRYVLPMPFNPKGKQIFHLILCSNFETGVRATKGFFCDSTYNPEYTPDVKSAFSAFKMHHPEVFQGLSGNRRPLYWRLLWKTITQHEEGICDYLCSDFNVLEQDNYKKQKALEWLKEKEYLKIFQTNNAWNLNITQYQLNWPIISEKLSIQQPPILRPLSLKPLSLKEISR